MKKSMILTVVATLIFTFVSPINSHSDGLESDPGKVEAFFEISHNFSNKPGDNTGATLMGMDFGALTGRPNGLNTEMNYNTEVKNETYRDREIGDGGDTPWSWSSIENKFDTINAHGMSVKFNGEQTQTNSAEFSSHEGSRSKAETVNKVSYEYKNEGDLYAGNSTNTLTSAWGGTQNFEWGQASHAGAESLVEGFVWSTPETGTTKMSWQHSVEAEAVAKQEFSNVSAKGSIRQNSEFNTNKPEDSFKTNTFKVETDAMTFGGGNYYNSAAKVRIYTAPDTEK
jgi:hypothetical protein